MPGRPWHSRRLVMPPAERSILPAWFNLRAASYMALAVAPLAFSPFFEGLLLHRYIFAGGLILAGALIWCLPRWARWFEACICLLLSVLAVSLISILGVSFGRVFLVLLGLVGAWWTYFHDEEKGDEQAEEEGPSP